MATDEKEEEGRPLSAVTCPVPFISFEGIDGCGKSTALGLACLWLEAWGIAHVRTREPGGTPMGEALRTTLLDARYSGMSSWAEALLHAANRAQHVEEVIRPALAQGCWVLSDRYADAALAYQGYGRGLDLDRLRRLHEWTTGGLWPHITILMDCDVATAHLRRRHRSGSPDRIEHQEEAFHESVRTGYLELARSEPERFIVLEAGRPLPEVERDLRALFQRLRSEWKRGSQCL